MRRRRGKEERERSEGKRRAQEERRVGFRGNLKELPESTHRLWL